MSDNLGLNPNFHTSYYRHDKFKKPTCVDLAVFPTLANTTGATMCCVVSCYADRGWVRARVGDTRVPLKDDCVSVLVLTITQIHANSYQIS